MTAAGKPEQQITITLRLFNFFMAEANRIHALMDVAEIPRELDGSVLSMAQRVEIYTQVTETLHVTFAKAKGHLTH